MKSYYEMSDFEINKEVASKLYGEDWWHKNGKVIINRQGADVFGDKFSGKVEVDYCNNPSDAWPIILDNKISIVNNYGWGAYHNMSGIESSMHVNPLVAAMTVYLMMKDAE